MPAHGVERVLTRNQFYWDSYRLLALSFFLLFILIFALGGYALYQQLTKGAPKYFATTPDGRIIPRIYTTEPVYTNPNDVIKWAENVVVLTYSLDYITFRKSLQDSAQYFTWRGHVDFLRALQLSNNLEAVKENKQVVSAEVTGTSQLVRQGVEPGASTYSWDLRIPLTITYQNSEKSFLKQEGIALVKVQRVTFLESLKGLAIAELIFQTP